MDKVMSAVYATMFVGACTVDYVLHHWHPIREFQYKYRRKLQ